MSEKKMFATRVDADLIEEAVKDLFKKHEKARDKIKR
jgi:hypothetical protein